MSVVLDIRSDISGAQDKLNTAKNAVMTAAIRAMNRTTTTVRKECSDELQQYYPGIKVSNLKARMQLVKAVRSVPEARIQYRAGRISMMGNFGMHRRGKFGVYFSKLPWRMETPEGDVIPSSMLQTNAFINRLHGGRQVVFVRLGDRRLPISVLLAPGIAKAVVEKGILAKEQDRGRVIFEKNFAHEMAYAKSRKDNNV